MAQKPEKAEKMVGETPAVHMVAINVWLEGHVNRVLLAGAADGLDAERAVSEVKATEWLVQ